MKSATKSIFLTGLVTITSAILIWNLLAEAVVYYEMLVTGATSRADIADDMGLGLLLLLVVPAGTLLLTVIVSVVAWKVIKKAD